MHGEIVGAIANRTLRAAATATRARGAREAMLPRENAVLRDTGQRQIPEVQRVTVPPLHPEHLIETAIRRFAPPTDADRTSAHQSRNGFRF